MKNMGLIISGAIGFAVGAGLVYYYRKDIERVIEKNELRDSRDFIEKKVDVQTSTNENSKADVILDMIQAQREMKQYATAFYGCYNGLYGVAQGTTKYRDTIIRDWNQRMSDEKKYPMLQRYWQSLFESYKTMTDQQYAQAAGEFMRFLEQCGIRHDEVEGMVRVDENTKMFYGSWEESDENWQIGEEKKVKLPAWYINDTVLEKGFLY